MIDNPIIRYLLIGAIPLLVLAIWGCFRAQYLGSEPLSKLIARLRDRMAGSW